MPAKPRYLTELQFVQTIDSTFVLFMFYSWT